MIKKMYFGAVFLAVMAMSVMVMPAVSFADSNASAAKVSSSKEKSSILITEPRIRAMPPGTNNTAAYMNIKNTGKTNIALEKVTSPVSDNIMLHETVKKNGKMVMEHQMAITVPAGKRVKLVPGGLHIMIMKVNKTLMTGDKVMLDLHFSNGEVVTVKTPVKKQVLEKGNLSG